MKSPMVSSSFQPPLFLEPSTRPVQTFILHLDCEAKEGKDCVAHYSTTAGHYKVLFYNT